MKKYLILFFISFFLNYLFAQYEPYLGKVSLSRNTENIKNQYDKQQSEKAVVYPFMDIYKTENDHFFIEYLRMPVFENNAPNEDKKYCMVGCFFHKQKDKAKELILAGAYNLSLDDITKYNTLPLRIIDFCYENGAISLCIDFHVSQNWLYIRKEQDKWDITQGESIGMLYSHLRSFIDGKFISCDKLEVQYPENKVLYQLKENSIEPVGMERITIKDSGVYEAIRKKKQEYLEKVKALNLTSFIKN